MFKAFHILPSSKLSPLSVSLTLSLSVCLQWPSVSARLVPKGALAFHMSYNTDHPIHQSLRNPTHLPTQACVSLREPSLPSFHPVTCFLWTPKTLPVSTSHLKASYIVLLGVSLSPPSPHLLLPLPSVHMRERWLAPYFYCIFLVERTASFCVLKHTMLHLRDGQCVYLWNEIDNPLWNKKTFTSIMKCYRNAIYFPQ